MDVSVVAANLDGDALPDLLVGSGLSGAFAFFATGPGTYDAGHMITSKGVASVTDIDGDGLDDLALQADIGAGTGVTILFNKPATPGTFDPVTIGSGNVVTLGFGHYSNNTPRKDAILLDGNFNQGALYVQGSPRTFVEKSAMAMQGLSGSGNQMMSIPSGFLSVDLNADGLDDVVGNNPAGASAAALQCPALGSFYPSSQMEQPVSLGIVGMAHSSPVIVDLDANGKPDVVQIDSPQMQGGQFVEVFLQ